MSGKYNQWTAMWAISKATLRSIFKSPQAVFFSLFFPIVLIMVFGALSGKGSISLDVAIDTKSDTLNPIYFAIKNAPVFDINTGTEAEIMDKLKKGRITAIIEVREQKTDPARPQYDIHLKTTSASQRNLPALRDLLQTVVNKVTYNASQNRVAEITQEEIPGRQYRMIDFFLPGMLGFSLINSAVIGVAFVFFTLRETLVLKRMFATPVKKTFIVLGEGIARVLFHLSTSVLLLLFGVLFYHFTLAHGVATFVELLVLCFLGITVFMGFGFIVSSFAKTQNVIPIYANLFMFPQYFLSGTFFPKSLLPSGVQAIVSYLPLTALNDAMRKVSFEGMHLLSVGKEITVLLVWCLLVYSLLIRVFRWE